MPKEVLIVGGGFTGLTAAYRLAQDPAFSVTLVEGRRWIAKDLVFELLRDGGVANQESAIEKRYPTVSAFYRDLKEADQEATRVRPRNPIKFAVIPPLVRLPPAFSS